MKGLRFVGILLAAVVLVCATASQSQTGAMRMAQPVAAANIPAVASEHAADRGLLLGIYLPNAATWDDLRDEVRDQKWVPDVSMEPQGKYLTFWISRSGGGSVKIQAIEGLLVPRSTGFWHIGTQIVTSEEHPESNFAEQIWAVPAGEKPVPPKSDSGIDGRSIRLITYAGPAYVAYLLHWEGGAGAWEYVYPRVTGVDDSTKDLNVEKVLGPSAGALYKRLAKSMNHMIDTAKEGEDRDPCDCCTGDPTEWGISHAGDSWRVYARFHYGTSSSCSQGSEDRALKTAVPSSLAPGGSLNSAWDVLRGEAEAVMKSGPQSVRHLFVSPKEDLAIAVSTNGLAVLGIENLHIKSVLKIQAFDAPCIPIMEQWSMGRFVAAWDAAVQKERPAAMPAENAQH
jgi:hypothetical protein